MNRGVQPEQQVHEEVCAIPTLLTMGHGTATQEELTALFRGAGVRLVVDVRRFPGSRRHPHVATAELERWLPAADVAYRWEPRLGGRRRVPPEDRGADPWWRVEAFRAYAAHTRTEEFRAGLADVLTDLSTHPDAGVVVMCSETLWWRCHRRLVADALVLLHRVRVQHLWPDATLTEHITSAGVRITPEGLRYDGHASAD